MKKKRKFGSYGIVCVFAPQADAPTPCDAAEDTASPPLQPGYYLALWPKDTDYARAGRKLRFFGPFASVSVARLMQTSALDLQVVASAEATAVQPNGITPRSSRGRSAPTGMAVAHEAFPKRMAF